MPLPDAVLVQIDKYVDSLQPQIQPRISSEIDEFQTKTLDSLEDQIIKAFRSLFDKGSNSSSRSLNDSAPDSYGVGSLPFGNEIASLTRSFSFSQMADGASDDLQEIFNLTEGRSGGNQQSSRGFNSDSFGSAKGFLSAAVGAIAEHSNQRPGGSGGGQPDFMDGLLGVLSQTVKDASQNPEEKARLISPEIKEKLGVTLREQHAPLADQFTRIALDHIKKWLRGNTSSRDVGDGLKGEITDLVSGFADMFGKKSGGGSSSRGIDRSDGNIGGGGEGKDGGSGFSRVISDKLSTGLAKVHREVRLEFRKVLATIEKQLFELLPDKFQGPLEKILGGNPFDPSLDSKPSQQSSRGFGDDIKTKVVDKIRQLVRKVQEALRESILSVVNGGHRKFERSSWVFVQNIVESKVQKFLPDVRITVPDDIGNEGVSVGQPQGLASSQPPAGQRGGQPPNAGNPLGYQSPPQEQQSSYSQGLPSHTPSGNQHHDNRPPPGNPSSGAPGYNPSYTQPVPSAPYQGHDQHRSNDNQQHHGKNPSYGNDTPSYNKTHAQGSAHNQGPSYGQGTPGEAQSYYNAQPPQGNNQYYN